MRGLTLLISSIMSFPTFADLNILSGQLYQDPRWGITMYRTENLNANAAQILPLLPVTKQDRSIDTEAITRTIRYKDLIVAGERYGKFSYCVGTKDGGVTCQTPVGKVSWVPEPKGRQKPFDKWREYSYASEACFMQEEKKVCQHFF